ncbi:MAG TPA: penicillin-binding transpeptidase domain-containing protein, partial [Acetobacteraceae bacterium]|nr:penicillin-binding transpeptidase domain-containing protein [Acetobacteraceae bacterium]
HIWDSFDAAHDIHIGRFTISDFEGKHRFLMLPEVLAYSSNLGAAHIAMIMGGARQRAWLKNMGMFDRVPIELSEASPPQVHSEAAWGEVVTMTVGFGHGISETPLNIVAGTAAIANGGVYVKPTILAVDPTKPPEGRRVMQKSTSDLMRRLMRLVVTNGFGKKAEVAGYFPGGKTGTAEKNKGHGYEKHANVSAFMSVFPMQAPRYAVYMMLDEPHGNASTGGYSTAGQVAAPAAGKVIARVGPIMGLMPDIKDAAQIEQALAIPLQPAKGLVLGPIKVTEPATDPTFHPPEAVAGPVADETAQPDQAHRTQAEPANPQARPATVPAHLSKPGLLHKVQTGPARRPSAPAQSQPPVDAPQPDWLHKTEFDAAPGNPVVAPSGQPVAEPSSGLLHPIRFDPISAGPMSSPSCNRHSLDLACGILSSAPTVAA